MYEIRVHFDNGDHIDTRISGDIDTIVRYYLDHKFPFADESGRETTATARCVQFFPPVHMKHHGTECSLLKVYSLSPARMARLNLYFPFRAVVLEERRSAARAMKYKNSFAYVPGMFGPL